MNKYVKRMLQILFCILVLTIIIGILPNFISGFDQKDNVFIKNTEFETTDFTDLKPRIPVDPDDAEEDKRPEFYVQLHRLRQGNGITLAIRNYKPGKLSATDDELTEKLTIWLSNIDLKEYDLANKYEALAYYTFGGSAWPRAGCRAVIKNGKIKILKLTDTRVTAEIKTSFPCTYRSDTHHEKQIEWNKVTTFDELKFDQVTPWIGKAGNHVYDESYRR